MSAKNPHSGNPTQSTKSGKARKSIMFPHGEDLPLFTGQAPIAAVRRFIPQESLTQPSLLDLRPTLKGAEAKPEDKKPGAA